MVTALALHVVTVGLFLVLGAWVLVARPRAGENQALGLLLLLLAGSTAAYYRYQTAGSPAEGLAFVRFLTWYELPLLLLIPVLLDRLFLEDRRGRVTRLVLGGAAVLTGAMVLAHALRPAWFHVIDTGAGRVSSRHGVVPQDLAIVQGVLLAGLNAAAVAIAALVASDGERTGVQRRQAALVGLGFAFLAGHSGMLNGLTRLVRFPTEVATSWLGPDTAIHLVGLIVVLWSIPRLARAFEDRHPERLVAVALLPLLGGVWDSQIFGLFEALPDLANLSITRPVWIAGFAVCLTVAVIRYGLAGVSDVDASRLAAVTGVLGLVSVMGAGVGIALASWGITPTGLAAGVGAVGITLALPWTPLRELPERMVERVRLDPDDPAVARERARVYRRALEGSVDAQGSIPEDRRPMLAALREELGFTERDHVLLMSALEETDPTPVEERVVLGRYHIDGTLGEGATAVTYEATDGYLGRSVVLKHVQQMPEDRGVEEARALASVEHPRVRRVYDVQPYGDGVLLVLEHVDGASLDEILERVGRLDAEEGGRYAIDLLEGLSAVHEAGLVHGDVKPGNVLVDDRERATLADFGAARWRHEGVDQTQPITGLVATPSTAAPEQLAGEPLRPATDLYALGAVLFRMLAGRGDPVPAVRGGPPDVEDPRIPASVGAVIRRAMQPDPADRFASAAEMADALSAALSEGGLDGFEDEPGRPDADDRARHERPGASRG